MRNKFHEGDIINSSDGPPQAEFIKANTIAFLAMPCVLQCGDDELHKFDNMWFSDQTSHNADWVAPAFEQFYEEVQKGVIDSEGVEYKLPCKVERINIKTDNCAREFNCAKYLRDVFERCEESNMDECWAEYGAPFHGKGPCDATGGAGKAGVNKGLATPGISLSEA